MQKFKSMKNSIHEGIGVESRSFDKSSKGNSTKGEILQVVLKDLTLMNIGQLLQQT